MSDSEQEEDGGLDSGHPTPGPTPRDDAQGMLHEGSETLTSTPNHKPHLSPRSSLRRHFSPFERSLRLNLQDVGEQRKAVKVNRPNERKNIDAAEEIINLSLNAMHLIKERSRLELHNSRLSNELSQARLELSYIHDGNSQLQENDKPATFNENVFRNVSPNQPRPTIRTFDVAIQVEDARPRLEQLEKEVKKSQEEKQRVQIEYEQRIHQLQQKYEGIEQSNTAKATQLEGILSEKCEFDQSKQRMELELERLREEKMRLELEWSERLKQVEIKYGECLQSDTQKSARLEQLQVEKQRAEETRQQLERDVAKLLKEREQQESAFQYANGERERAVKDHDRLERLCREAEEKYKTSLKQLEKLQKKTVDDRSAEIAQLTRLEADLEFVRRENGDLKEVKKQREEQIEKLDTEIRQLHEQYTQGREAIEAERDAIKKQFEEIQQSDAAKTAQLVELQELMQESESAHWLLEQKSTETQKEIQRLNAELERTDERLKQNEREGKQREEEWTAAKEKLEKDYRQLNTNYEEAVQLRDHLVKESGEFEATRIRFARKERELNEEKEQREEEIREMQKQRDKLRKEIERLKSVEVENASHLVALERLKRENTSAFAEIAHLRPFKYSNRQRHRSSEESEAEAVKFATEALRTENEHVAKKVELLLEEKESLEKQLSDLNAEKRWLEESLDKANQRGDDLQSRATHLERDLDALQSQFHEFRENAELQYQTDIAILANEKQALHERVLQLESYPGKYLSVDGRHSSRFWDAIPEEIRLQLDSLATSNDDVRLAIEWLRSGKISERSEEEKKENKGAAVDKAVGTDTTSSPKTRSSQLSPRIAVDPAHIEWRKALDRFDELIKAIEAYKRFKFESHLELPERVRTLLVGLLDHARNGNDAVAAAASRFWEDMMKVFNVDIEKWKHRVEKAKNDEAKNTQTVQRELDTANQEMRQLTRDLKGRKSDVQRLKETIHDKDDEMEQLNRNLSSAVTDLHAQIGRADEFKRELDEKVLQIEHLKRELQNTEVKQEQMTKENERVLANNRSLEAKVHGFQTEFTERCAELKTAREEVERINRKLSRYEETKQYLSELRDKYEKLVRDFEIVYNGNEDLMKTVDKLRRGNANREKFIHFMRDSLSKKVNTLLSAHNSHKEYMQLLKEFEAQYEKISPSTPEKDLDFSALTAPSTPNRLALAPKNNHNHNF